MVLALVGRRIAVVSHKPAHLDAIVSELVSIRQFKQDLIPNRADTRLVYCRDTEEGVGIYFCRTSDGKSNLLCEQQEKRHNGQRFTMLGWAPDDVRFAFAFPSRPERKEEQIVICDGSSGEQLARLQADPNLFELAWLSSSSFAYSTSLTKDLYVVEEQVGNEWKTNRHFSGVERGKMDNLTATSTNSLAWLEAGEMWTMQLDWMKPSKVWHGVSNGYQLAGFSYSRKAKEFFLDVRGPDGQFYSRFSLGSEWSTNIVARSEGSSIGKAVWSGDSPQYVYANLEGTQPVFSGKTSLDAQPWQEPWRGWIRNWSLGVKKLYLTGCPDDSFPGIWEYDLGKHIYRCIVPGLDRPLRDAQQATAVTGTLNGAFGPRPYRFWAPTSLAAGRKHPVVIAEDYSNWFPYSQIAANAGYFFIIADASCLESLRQKLAKHPNVDTNRMYLYGSNNGAWFVANSIRANSDPWKGAVLFDPMALPTVAALEGKRALIVSGADDKWVAVDRLTQFQDLAATMHVPVKLFFLNHAQHLTASTASERKRARAFAMFLGCD
jgi:hypothetical protein